MDPELRALLDKYAAAGATDEELLHIAGVWKQQHATVSQQPAGPVAPHGTSGTWNGPAPKRNPLALPASVMRNAPSPEDVKSSARLLGATALGLALPETKIATALDAVPGVGPFVAKAVTRLATGGLTGAVAAGPGNRRGGAATGAVLGPTLGVAADALGSAANPVITKIAARGRNYPLLRDILSKSVDATNDVNYGNAINAATGREATPAIQHVLNDPYMAPHIASLKLSPEFGRMSETDPRFLNALYKQLSDVEGGAVGRLESVDPARPNATENMRRGAGVLKNQLLRAMEAAGEKPPIVFDVPAEAHTVEPQITPGREPQRGPVLPGTAGRKMGNQAQVSVDASGRATAVSPRDVQGPAGPAFQLRAQPDVVKPGIVARTPAMRIETAPAKPIPAYMPEYRGAVDQAKEGFTQLDALQKGYEALPALGKRTQMTPQQVEEFGMPALQHFLEGESPEVAKQLRTGIQASNNANPFIGRQKFMGITFPTGVAGTAKTAPKVLRAFGDPGQLARDRGIQNGQVLFRNTLLPWLIEQGYLPDSANLQSP